MPKVKLYEEREAFKEPPPEPEKFSRLEDFDWNQTIYQTYVLPQFIFKRLEKIADKEKFLCQCLLDLIQDAKGVQRREPAKPREAWYSYTRKVRTHKLFKFEKIDDKVSPYIEVEAQHTRKRIPFPDDKQVVFFEPAKDEQRQASNFQVPIRLWNEAYRLSEAFQMTVYDMFLQAVERGLFKREQQQARHNPNAARYKRFSDREERREQQLVESVVKRIGKNQPPDKEPA